jgi:beta-N-acetylhexosaminidase
MNFAPILDINSNPKNPVIGDRAFGIEPEVVTSLGIATMKGIQSQNIASVVKHFPGHGDTSVDSHVGLPIVYNDLDRLKSFELVPFSEAVKDGADAVMIAHILLPKIDAENPASLSRTFITDILRGDLGFDGVVITDDMTMGAIAKKYNIGDAAVKSFNAGSDIILVCHDYYRQTAVIDALIKAAKTGNIKEETIDSSVYRILKLKQKYGIADSKINSIDVNQVSRLVNDVNERIHLP